MKMVCDCPDVGKYFLIFKTHFVTVHLVLFLVQTVEHLFRKILPTSGIFKALTFKSMELRYIIVFLYI